MRNLCQNNDSCNYVQAFVITFSFGMGAIPWLMMSEVHYLDAYLIYTASMSPNFGISLHKQESQARTVRDI
jgi:hypothetical protein